MKKKLLSLLLASSMALTACAGLAACGGDEKRPAGSDLPTSATINIWCPDGAIKYYTGLVEKFKEENANAKEWNVTFEAKGEGDVKAALGTDAKNGAEMFFIASNAISDLVTNNALQALTPDYEKAVKERDAQGAIDAATKTVDGVTKIYAYPNVNSNGYFLAYDSEVYSEEDVKNLDTLIAKTPKGKHIIYDYANGFYNPTFFFGMDVGLGDTQHGDVVMPDMGKAEAAAKTMLKYFGTGEKGVFVSSTGNNAIAVGMGEGTVTAGVSGTWMNENGYMDKLVADKGWAKDRIKYAKLPEFTVTDCGDYDGTYQMGSFMGAKYLGVNAQKDAGTIKACLALGNYFNTEEAQIGRFNATSEAPTNNNAASSDAVKANPMISALMQQNNAGGVMQLDTPKDFWSSLETFGKEIYTGVTTSTNLSAKLAALKAGLEAK